MRRWKRGLLMWVSAGLLVGCYGTSGGSTSGESRGGADVLTQEQIAESNYNNVYDLVRALRPNWINYRGTESLTAETPPVVVYRDDQRLGGVEELRQILLFEVESVHHIKGMFATSRWGLDHSGGVIQVVSRTP